MRCCICTNTPPAATVRLGALCPAHDKLAVLWAAVRTGDCSEWRANSGGPVCHVDMQTKRANRGATGHWTREVADVLRLHGPMLDGWDEAAAA